MGQADQAAQTTEKDKHFAAWASIRAIKDYLQTRTEFVDPNYIEMCADVEKYLEAIRVKAVG